MQYKDTLKLYDELRAAGATEDLARIQATQLGSIGDFLESFKREIETSLSGIKKDLLWMRIIGAGLILIFSANLLHVIK